MFKLDKTDYKGWAKGLRKAGYATDPKYPAKLISLIERYDLYKFDKENSEQTESVIQTVEKKESIYVVEPGDTLYKISKQFGTTVEELKKIKIYWFAQASINIVKNKYTEGKILTNLSHVKACFHEKHPVIE